MSLDERSLPNAWSLRVLSEIAGRPQYGWTTRARRGEGVRLLRTTDITAGRIDWNSVPACEEIPHDLSKYRLRPGDIVISRAGSVGFSSLIDELCPRNAVFASYLVRIHPDSDVVRPRYLSQYMRSPYYWQQIGAASVGIGMANVNGSKLAAMTVPVPPLEQQDVLVSMLDEFDASRRSASGHLSNARRAVDTFRRAALGAACTGRLTADWREENSKSQVGDRLEIVLNRRHEQWKRSTRHRSARVRYPEPLPAEDADMELPETWRIASLSQLAHLDVGHAFKSAEFAEAGIRLLRGENSAPHRLKWNEIRYWPEKRVGEFQHLLLQEGDLVLGMDRPIVSAGLKLAHVTKDDLPCLLVQRVLRIRAVEPPTSRFIETCLRDGRFERFLAHDGMTGTDLPHITGEGVSRFPIPLPPLVEQLEIIRRLDQLLSLVARLETRIRAAEDRATRGSKAILAKAFRGELSINGFQESNA